MPRNKPAPGKHPSTSKRRRPEPTGLERHTWKNWTELPPPTPNEMFAAMRGALHDTVGFVQALVLIGHGLEQIGREEGDAVVSVASAAQERLRIVEDTWLDYVQALRR